MRWKGAETYQGEWPAIPVNGIAPLYKPIMVQELCTAAVVNSSIIWL